MQSASSSSSHHPALLPPGTPAYRSPEAWLFNLQFRHSPERYRAGPAELEQAADSLIRPSSLSTASGPEPAAVRSAEAPASSSRAFVHSQPPWLALAVVAGALATWAGWMTRAVFSQAPEVPYLRQPGQ